LSGETTEMPYSLLVSRVGGRPARFVFNQERVLVGRGLEADLRLEHAGVSRQQFLLERGRGSAGEARFRITPYDSTNPTFLNGLPAVEGTITPGDVVAIVGAQGGAKPARERAEERADFSAADGASDRDHLHGAVGGLAFFR
jgi:hypothetical protein